jgi:hypothetical protein
MHIQQFHFLNSRGNIFCTPLFTGSPRTGIVTATLQAPEPRHALLLSFLQPLLQCNIRPSPPPPPTNTLQKLQISLMRIFYPCRIQVSSLVLMCPTTDPVQLCIPHDIRDIQNIRFVPHRKHSRCPLRNATTERKTLTPHCVPSNFTENTPNRCNLCYTPHYLEKYEREREREREREEFRGGCGIETHYIVKGGS